MDIGGRFWISSLGGFKSTDQRDPGWGLFSLVHYIKQVVSSNSAEMDGI